jgi:hypothetical protein
MLYAGIWLRVRQFILVSKFSFSHKSMMGSIIHNDFPSYTTDFNPIASYFLS